MRKFSTMIVAATMLATPAMTKCDVNNLIMDGILSHGSIECNPAWMDRSASLIEVERARDCRRLEDKARRTFLARGMADFDRKVRELGKAAACKQLDETMTKIERSVTSE